MCDPKYLEKDLKNTIEIFENNDYSKHDIKKSYEIKDKRNKIKINAHKSNQTYLIVEINDVNDE